MLKMNPGCNATFFDDFDFLANLVKENYKNDHPAGRDPIDPRTLFLACLLEFLEGYSDIEVARKIQSVPLYRWFVGLSFEDKAPDDTTISFFRVNRMGEEKFQAAFQQIIK